MNIKKMLSVIICLSLLLTSFTGCGILSEGESTDELPDSSTESSVSGNVAGTFQTIDPPSASSGKEAAESVTSQSVNKLSGLKYSILGDSVSSFTGYMPQDYNIFYPESGEIHSVESTWWFKAFTNLSMELCANASSSNTCVSGDSADTTGSAPGCSTRRINDLRHPDSSPDVIIVFMGINDFLKSVPLGRFTAPGARQEGITSTFCEAYELMLQKILTTYPDAAVYCFTLTETDAGDVKDPRAFPAVNENSNTIADFNAEIAAIASAYNVSVVNVYECGITYDNLMQYTGDGLHPNPDGATLISDYVTAYFQNSDVD